MVAVAMFDTLAYSKKLEAVGVPSEVAAVQAFTLAEIIEDRLATKDDLKPLATKEEVQALGMELKGEIQALESRIDKRFNEVDKRFHEVDNRFNNMDRRIDKLEHLIDKLSTQLTVRLGSIMAAGIILLESIRKFFG